MKCNNDGLLTLHQFALMIVEYYVMSCLYVQTLPMALERRVTACVSRKVVLAAEFCKDDEALTLFRAPLSLTPMSLTPMMGDDGAMTRP